MRARIETIVHAVDRNWSVSCDDGAMVMASIFFGMRKEFSFHFEKGKTATEKYYSDLLRETIAKIHENVFFQEDNSSSPKINLGKNRNVLILTVVMLNNETVLKALSFSLSGRVLANSGRTVTSSRVKEKAVFPRS